MVEVMECYEDFWSYFLIVDGECIVVIMDELVDMVFEYDVMDLFEEVF